MNIKSDYIIVGAGSAGCVLASRLTENPKCTVTLIEAGGNDINPLIHIPAGYVKTMLNPNINWMYKTQSSSVLNNRNIDFPRGKVLGGSSAINGMLYVRGQAADYDSWAKLGNKGWAFKDLLPYFTRSQNSEEIEKNSLRKDYLNKKFHGIGGPLNVADIRSNYEILDKLIIAAETCGYPKNNDFNGKSQEGFGYYQVTQKNGLRASTKHSFLDPIKNRKNLNVLTNCHVKSLIFQNNDFETSNSRKVIGINYFQQNLEKKLYVNQEVIISAGTINSPQILELSGIGEPQTLKNLGIAVRNEVPGVGNNLSDHFISRLSWELKRNISLNKSARGIPFLIEILKFLFLRKGLLSLPAGILGGFVKSNNKLENPDIQFHIAHASFENPEKRIFHKFPGITLGPCQLKPKSKGHVHITSKNPFSPPKIQPNYLENHLDQQVHIAGMKIAREIMGSDLMTREIIRETKPGENLRSNEDLIDYAKQTGVTLYHPTSTCKMGPNIRQGDVVNDKLEVYGMSGLRIVDASIMPQIVSGNTNAPTIMIAEKGADLIRGQ